MYFLSRCGFSKHRGFQNSLWDQPQPSGMHPASIWSIRAALGTPFLGSRLGMHREPGRQAGPSSSRNSPALAAASYSPSQHILKDLLSECTALTWQTQRSRESPSFGENTECDRVCTANPAHPECAEQTPSRNPSRDKGEANECSPSQPWEYVTHSAPPGNQPGASNAPALLL